MEAEKTMTLEDALAFSKTNIENFGFSVSYMAENPNDKNNEPAFGFFPISVPKGKRKFWCDVDGSFQVVSADSVIVSIYNANKPFHGLVI